MEVVSPEYAYYASRRVGRGRRSGGGGGGNGSGGTAGGGTPGKFPYPVGPGPVMPPGYKPTGFVSTYVPGTGSGWIGQDDVGVRIPWYTRWWDDFQDWTHRVWDPYGQQTKHLY